MLLLQQRAYDLILNIERVRVAERDVGRSEKSRGGESVGSSHRQPNLNNADNGKNTRTEVL